MKTQEILNAECWANKTFGACKLKDIRRTARAVKVLKTDEPELVIMPGPGRLMKALMDFFPGMGPGMNQRAGVTVRMKQVADLREQEGAHGTIRLASVDPDFSRRLDPSVVIAEIKELKGKFAN